MGDFLIVVVSILSIIPVGAVLMHERRHPPLRTDQIIDSRHPHRTTVRSDLTRGEASWPR